MKNLKIINWEYFIYNDTLGTTGHPFYLLSNHYNFDIKWNLNNDIMSWKKAIINKDIFIELLHLKITIDLLVIKILFSYLAKVEKSSNGYHR